MKPVEAIVLAGGKGTRLQSKVSNVPKPLAPVRGRPFLEHFLDYWIGQGVGSFVISVGHLAEMIPAHFGESYRGARIRYCRETKPLGTGGATLLALSLLQSDAPALLLNGDSLFGISLDELLRFHASKKSRFTLSLTRVDDNIRYSHVRTDEDGRCTSMEPPPAEGRAGRAADVNGGVYCIDPAFARSWKNPTQERMISLELEMIPDWISRGEPVYGWKAGDARFLDIGTPEDYARAESFFE